MRASWAEFSESVTWPGFQARVPQFGAAVAKIGLDEIERDLGHYVGLINQQARADLLVSPALRDLDRPGVHRPVGPDRARYRG